MNIKITFPFMPILQSATTRQQKSRAKIKDARENAKKKNCEVKEDHPPVRTLLLVSWPPLVPQDPLEQGAF
jgi:hypothetical protein